MKNATILKAVIARLQSTKVVAAVDFFDTLVKAMPREFFNSNAGGIRGVYKHKTELFCERERHPHDTDYETYVFSADGAPIEQDALADFLGDVRRVAVAEGYKQVNSLSGLAKPRTFVLEAKPDRVRLTLRY